MENQSANMAPESSTGANDSFVSTYSTSFQEYARPLIGRLLKGFQLDISYSRGFGNWLWGHREAGQEMQVFDGCGGYGANLFGHSNPFILARAQELLLEAPNLTQGSWRNLAGELGQKLSEIISAETGQGPWISHLSNTGAECAEAALKHILMDYELRQDELKRKILSGFVAKSAQNLLGQKPIVIALSAAYHGKTQGALSLTYNQSFKMKSGDLPWEVCHLPINDLKALKIFLKERTTKLEIQNENGELIKTVPYLPLAGVFIEAIQGEGGIHELSQEYAQALRQLCDQAQATLVADEIQCGLFRTGKMAALSHLGVSADIYLLSKALGGGIAKIGVTLIKKSKYHEELGRIHSSTFAEDHFSSGIALRVLELINRPSFVERSMQNCKFALEELKILKADFPQIIKEIRGKGAMLAIEFSEDLLDQSFEFRILGTHDVFGHYLSSLLLNHEHIRIAPTLSSPMSLRWEPSLPLEIDEIQFFIHGLRNLCQKLQDKDVEYLFGNLGGTPETTMIPSKIEVGQRPITAFLCHTIDQKHLDAFCPGLKGMPQKNYQNLSEGLAKVGEFAPYVQRTLASSEGVSTDVLLMAAPIDSAHMAKYLRDPMERGKIVAKIQRAIDYAFEMGVQTVGLGQFTSIISNNGLELDSRGMNLTTGNSFTAALSLEAGLSLVKARGIDIKTLKVGIVGAAGNIMSTSAQFMSSKVKELHLYYHTPWEQSEKWQVALKELVRVMTPEALDWKEELKKQMDSGFLGLHADLKAIEECDLIFVGTNDPGLKFAPELFKANAIIVDASVPSHFDREFKLKRPDITVCLGGIASFPLSPEKTVQAISSNVIPVPPGESFACLAETIMMSWMGLKGYSHIGPLTLESIERSLSWAKQTGVGLARLKNRTSF